MGLSRLRIALRLPAFFFLITALSLTVMGYMSYSTAKRTLTDSGEAELEEIAQSRAKALETWAGHVISDLTMQSRNALVYNALRSFNAAWASLGPTAAQRLTTLYATDQRDALTNAEDGSVYSLVHTRFHDHFRGLARRGGYADVLLVSPEGNVVYSVMKDSDFAAGPADLAEQAVLKRAREVMQQEAGSEPVFLDFADYRGLSGQSAFVIAPVGYGGNVTLGAMIIRLTAATITENLGQPGGLGTTGQAFVIGADGRPRTPAANWIPATVGADSPLEAALRGESGVTGEALEQSTAPGMLTGFAPADVFGQRWIFTVMKSRKEVLAPISSFLSTMELSGGAILVLAAILGTLIARSVTRPLRALSHSITAVRDEDYDTPVPHVARGDELGSIARDLEGLRGTLEKAHALQTEMAFQTAALASTSAALMITDEDFNITYLNQAVRDMMRKQVSEFRKILASFDPDNLVGVNMDIFHAAPGQIRALIQQPDRLPFRTDIRVGNARVQIELNAVYGKDKSFAGLVVEWVDVTELRRRTSVLNAIDSGQIFVECDVSGDFRRVNENFTRLIGRSESDLIGTSFTGCIRLDGDGRQDGLLATVLGGEAVQGRFLVSCPNCPDALIEGGLYPITDSRGDTSGITLIGSDVTAAQAALRAAEERQKIMQAAQQKVVEALRVGMRDISNGDLTSRLNTPFAPEYEQLRTDFNDALTNLTRAMGNIAQQTSAMQNETAEIVKAADEMSVRTERQAMTLQDTAASLDELTTNIALTADGAARANQVVTEARARAEESGSVVDEAENAMAEIASSSREIVKVISVIDDISFQTNLLALNAGVEAARAGEAGRGFAVVATEVRALAQRCANAAAEINQLITVSGQHVSRGVELVGVTGETLKKIVSSISEISDYIAEIAQAGKEQSIGLNQVNSAVNQIDHVTQQNAAMFEETTSASHALAHRAESLAETIGHFRVDESATGEAPPVSRARPARSSGRSGGSKGNLALAPNPALDATDWEDF